TGIGKTQLGVQYAHTGVRQEGRAGVIYDMTARGDAQSHSEYAQRMCDWTLRHADPAAEPPLADFYSPKRVDADYLHVFRRHGRRVTRGDMDWEQWRAWQSEINARLATTIAFFYGNFVAGAQRVVIDGIEPADRPGESIQLELVDYIYHQVLRKDPEWVARDLFRQHYRSHADDVARHTYATERIGCLLLYTSHETMLEDLISRPIDQGDALANANTLIYMGKVRDGARIGRGLYIAKHRGSACSDEIVPYAIGQHGLEVLD
ncbi:MAG: recombinase RecA, partial [Planctomycetales bacterium]|nr:recombinase RecA [Planctomycetales bacterium]